jgi:hypothetical protein
MQLQALKIEEREKEREKLRSAKKSAKNRGAREREI